MPRPKKVEAEPKKKVLGSAEKVKSEVVVLENGETATMVTYPDGTTRKVSL